MKAHKYWSIGAVITMFGTFCTGYKGSKTTHKYLALSSLICMVPTASLPSAAETDAVNRCFINMVPHGYWIYFPLMARLTVEV